MPERAPQCWSCLEFLESGVSLDGGRTLHLCKPCWKKLPPYRRVQLQLLCRSVEDGGLGLRDAVERFLSAIDLAEGERPPFWTRN